MSCSCSKYLSIFRWKEAIFSNKRLAEIAYHVLCVDKEPLRGQVEKHLHVSDNVLKGYVVIKYIFFNILNWVIPCIC